MFNEAHFTEFSKQSDIIVVISVAVMALAIVVVGSMNGSRPLPPRLISAVVAGGDTDH